MANTVSNVTAGKPAVGGAVYRAPIGTTAPTDATTSLGGSFVGLGYCSSDGLVNTNSPESSEIVAWGGDVVLDTQTSKPDTFALTLIEALKKEVLETVYNAANVTGSSLAGGLAVSATTAEADEYVWVFDLILRGNTLKRIVIPRGKITEVGDISYVDEDVVGYPLTIKAYPDSSGVTHKEYIKKASSSS